MFQTWGRFRSLTNGQRNGGFQRTGLPDPGTAPGARHGVPPRNFRPSQTARPATSRSTQVTARGPRPAAGRSRRTADRPPRVAAAVAIGLARHRLIGDVQRAVDDREAPGEPVLGDAEGRGWW